LKNTCTKEKEQLEIRERGLKKKVKKEGDGGEKHSRKQENYNNGKSKREGGFVSPPDQ